MASFENMDGWYDEIETLINNRKYFEAFSDMQEEKMPFSCVLEMMSLLEKDSTAREALNFVNNYRINVLSDPEFVPDPINPIPDDMLEAGYKLERFYLWYKYKKQRPWSTSCRGAIFHACVKGGEVLPFTSNEFLSNLRRWPIDARYFDFDK